MDWFNVKSEQELRELGKFKELKTKVLDELNLNGVITFRGFNVLYLFIKKLQEYDGGYFLEADTLKFISDYSNNKTNIRFADFKARMLAELKLTGVIAIRNKSCMLTLILQLQYFISNIKSEKSNSEFFVSEKHKLAYMFIHYNACFNEELGIKRVHYIDKDKAKLWRNQYIKLFHPDQLDQHFAHQHAADIANSITQIYHRMVGKA